MGTIYFLIIIGIGAFGVVWATRTSTAKTDLARKSKATSARQSSEKLTTPADNRLSHREQIWETRQTRANKGFIDDQSYVPKSVAGKDPQYDGYSRRDRHHVAPTGRAKEHIHIDEKDGFAVTSGKIKSREHATQT